MFLIMSVFVLVVGGLLALDSFVIVKQKRAVAIERLGKFHSIKGAGFHLKIPIIDRVHQEISLKLMELNVPVETKTKDNVFVQTAVSVQLRVIEDKVKEAVYELEDPQKQAKTYIFDVVRAEVPKMTLDQVFETKDDIAKAINDSLKAKMNEYGFDVESTQVTDVDPDQAVKDAMNQIQTTERLKVAAQNEAEAEKIRVVKEAEASAEAKRLTGKGYADLRKEIAEGAKESVKNLTDTGLSAQEATSFMLSTQYFETLSDVGSQGNTVLMMPNGDQGGSGVLKDLLTAGSVNPTKKAS
jgi:regulator of protease activity HflC (stomatin/prohibitin superfamily)